MTARLLLAALLLAPGLAFAQDPPAGEKPPETKPEKEAPAPEQPAPPAPRPNKASIAVMKFSCVETVLKCEDGVTRRYLHEFDTGILTNKFVTALVNTHKFDVVDRDKLDKILKEQQFGETGQLDPARCVKAGKMIGADYFLTGAISYFTVGQKSIENPYARGNWTHTVTAEIVVDMRIVDTRTSKIVSAEKGEARVSTKFQSGIYGEVSLAPRLLDDLQRALCESLCVKTIDGVFPVKIITSKDGVLFLNRGEGGGLQVGDVLDVFQLGEDLVDPDTGASLGQTETKLGQIRVTSVEAKFSKAEAMTEGAQFPRGSICRKPKLHPADGR